MSCGVQTYSTAERRSDGRVWNADGYWEAEHEPAAERASESMSKLYVQIAELEYRKDSLRRQVDGLQRQAERTKPAIGPPKQVLTDKGKKPFQIEP